MTTRDGANAPDGGSAPDDTPGMDQQNSSPDSPETPGSPGSAGSSGSPGSVGTPESPDVPEAATAREPRWFAALGEPLNGETVDEEALRTLMRGAVQDLQASPDALDHLRRAIPVRRQRRRQAMVGAAAALLFAGMAIPALVHAAAGGGGTAAAPAGIADSPSSHPGEDGHTRPSGGPSGQASAGPGGPASHRPSSGPGGPASLPATPTDTAAPAPDCSSAQLGQAASNADAPDADGRVYGWFRVANVSDTACTVPSGGMVQAVAQGAADPSRIQVVDHTEGDPASALPTPATSGPVVLNPGDDYEVAFAWVPSADGPGGCVEPTTPPTTPTPTATSTGTASAGGDAGTSGTGVEPDSESPQSGGDPSTPPAGSIALTHTPAAGAPVVGGPVIQNACAGTVYKTSAIPMSPSGASGS